MKHFNTPILFLVFNRPDTTRQVFKKIREAAPPRLYIAADGPRKGEKNETKKCEQVRRIATKVDWECEVNTLFREENLGCKMAVSEGINWFFENEEMGIVLEDDCLPNKSFFKFCEELLLRYRTDERIYLISGHNKQDTWKPEKCDYFFSNLGGIWGWASWRRAWRHFDIKMSYLDEFIKRNHFKNLLGDELGNLRKKEILNAPETTWDYQWGFARHLNSGLACVPSKNLIKNIGFGENSTHTQSAKDKVKLHKMTFPMEENKFVVPDKGYDKLFMMDNSIITKVKKGLTSFFSENN